MTVATQVHDRFKVFVGKLGADHSVGSIADQVTKFSKENRVAPKSIGVEFLEGSEKLVVTLGYRGDGDSYPVTLKSVSLGNVPLEEGGDFSALEQRMASAASSFANVICHELFVTGEGELVMVFMTLA